MNSHIVLTLLGTGEAYLADLRKEHRGRVELCEVQEDSDDENQVSRSRYADTFYPCFFFFSEGRNLCGSRSAMTVARFDPSGKHIFIGTSSGSVLVFNTRTKTVSDTHLTLLDFLVC